MNPKNNQLVSHFAKKYAKTPSSTSTFQEAFEQIKSCQLSEKIELLRRHHITAKTYKDLKEKDTEGIHLSDYQARHERAASEAARIKQSLPAFVWSGECTTRMGGAFKHNGILCLDIDGKNHPRLQPRDMIAKVKPLSYVLGWFISPSGDGLKVLIRIKPDESLHLRSFLAAEHAFDEVGLKVDPACKDVRRLCFVSSDPHAVLRPWKDTTELSVADAVDEGLCYTDDTDNTDKEGGGRGDKMRGRKPLTQAKKEQAADHAREEMNKKPGLKRLYWEYVEKRFIPEQGQRNSRLVRMVTFLFHTVGEKRVMELAMLFYDTNQDIFIDSRKQHEKEARCHFNKVKKTWQDELTEIELEAIDDMNPIQIEMFRICRDIQDCDVDDYPPGFFFISFNDMGSRICKTPIEAQRELRRFAERKILKITKMGDSFRKGRKGGKATEYKWLLAYTVPPSKARSCAPKKTKVTATAKPRKRREIQMKHPCKQNHRMTIKPSKKSKPCLPSPTI